jgi:hypothetical protein
MNVIPFPRPQAEHEPLAFTIGARVDLRVGALAAGIVRPRGAPEHVYAYTHLTRLLRAARMAWLERGAHAALALAIAPAAQRSLDPDLLSEAAVEAGCTRPNFSFELDEREIVAVGPSLAEDLRARGWGVILRGDPDCPLPFGARARALYGELVLEPPPTADPFLGLDPADRSMFGQRLRAARAAGLVVTAETVRNSAQARLLATAGFNRGGGPFAESGLR